MAFDWTTGRFGMGGNMAQRGAGGFQDPAITIPTSGGRNRPRSEVSAQTPDAGIPGGETGLETGGSTQPTDVGGFANKTARKYGKVYQGSDRASAVLKKAGRAAKRTAAPALNVYENYYKPAYEQAYQAAQSMGVDPSLYGRQRAAERQQAAQFNRMGIGQSGAAMAARGQMAQYWADLQNQAAAQAAQQRYGAFSGLANQAYGQGMGAAQFAMNPAMAYAQHKGSQEAQAEQNAQMAQQGWGQFAGGIADLGLTAATGGAWAPMAGATGGFSGMFGGARQNMAAGESPWATVRDFGSQAIPASAYNWYYRNFGQGE